MKFALIDDDGRTHEVNNRNIAALGKAMGADMREAFSRAQRSKQLRMAMDRSCALARQITSQNRTIMLELGAGDKKGANGWTTIDMTSACDLFWDLNNPLPFPPNSVDKVYASHFFEHFFYPDLMRLLHDCYRVLKPGGILSACVPNARIWIEGYLGLRELDPARFCPYKPAFHYNTPIDFVNYIAYMDGHHRYLFDIDNLVRVISNAGFTGVKPRQFDPELDLAERDCESIYAEGHK